ncbi:SGNH/GDSL hydrolase family protein [Pedobacter sp. Du54]|uniref:SGNH/GDSL hydrolase family protein n=1 Tax=Pedobacter anseongensis TaxID=3133439 RepID=UPI0030A72118
MKKFYAILFLLFAVNTSFALKNNVAFYPANDSKIQYIGRVDFSNPLKPKMWASGAYLIFKISGSSCELLINDEVIYGTVHNYLQIKVDNQPAYRIQLKNKENKITLANGLAKGEHTIIICKNTEFENGYVEIVGISCEKLVPPPGKQKRKMEFIGDSITCGFGSDESEINCGTKGSQWYDQHNAYLAYGPTTARSLNAQYHLSAVSGIGLIHSCCDKKILMPQVFDKINMAKNELKWDFTKYQPDVVTVCLGQNDGVQDSTQFCSAYVKFAKTLRGYYPKAKLIFLTSPMADKTLKTALVKYISAVKATLIAQGEKNIGSYFFTKQSTKGCGSHPSLAEQKEIAGELTAYLKREMNW